MLIGCPLFMLSHARETPAWLKRSIRRRQRSWPFTSMTLVPEGLFLRQFTTKGTKSVIPPTGLSGGFRPSDKGGWLGRGVKNKGEPPGPLSWIRHWSFFITGFGIVRDSLSTVFKGLTVNLFACVSSYCLSCGNNEVNFLNLVFSISNALTIQPGKSVRQSFAFNGRFKIPSSSLILRRSEVPSFTLTI